jgi:hypothetical protein
MAMRQLVLAVTMLATACAPNEGDSDVLSDAEVNADDKQLSADNAKYFAECGLQTPECLSQSPLAGFWSCPSNDGHEFAVGIDGRAELLNHNGQHGIGCVTCDGAFELVSDEDNLGAAWVNVGGQLSVEGDALTITWLMCGARELEACRAEPGATRSETCERSE